MVGRYIPIPFLLKMGIYDVVAKPGVTIKTRVLDNADVLDICISKFKTYIVGNGNVVGLDVKESASQYCPKLIIICAGFHCLVIQPRFGALPDSLKQLLTDKTICFVGIELSKKLKQITLWKNIHYTLPPIGVELSYLAANVLKKPSISKCIVLKEIADEVGTDYKVPEDTCVDYGASVLSPDEVKHAIHEAYTCYDLAKSLLGKL